MGGFVISGGDRTSSVLREGGGGEGASTEPGQGGGDITNSNNKSGSGKGSGKGSEASRSNKKKSCNKLKGIKRVKCVLSKYKGSGSKAVGPNIL